MCEFLDLVLVECICKVAAPAEVTPLVVISESELNTLVLDVTGLCHEVLVS